MTWTIDPLDENFGINEDGQKLYAIRAAVIDDNGVPPTCDELSQMPIIGYSTIPNLTSERQPGESK